MPDDLLTATVYIYDHANDFQMIGHCEILKILPMPP